ncbi:MAG: CusA/CzcA family heavy metal efflux RND transporter [Hapalosiphonaceae cyanobacterium JJU2]|nr:MAG: CusA/CzcA family heavy metal efflux RND transporter [Hapalosiphonaceae cyanobacterium JJU2]
MLNSIVKWSIAQRWLVVIASIIISLWGFRVLTQMPLDVFPAFAPPQVEIQTEAPGLAPEEVESLVTRPIESAINGTPGVETVRSSSAVGISVVKVIFSWDTEIYRARQLVTERLQQAQSQLPQGVEPPQISPINSPLGAVIKYAFTSETTPLMEVRRIVDWQVKNRLLAVPGVTQIVVFGGDVRQYQVLVDPNKLKAFNVSLNEVTEATEKANVNAPGGFLINPDQEMLVREVGRIESIDELKQSAITARNGTPVLLSQVADVKIGAELKRGDATLNGKKAVVVVVNKQPQADTPTVTRAVEAAMSEIKASLPKDVKVNVTFRQENFIEASLKNVEDALRDGIIIVSAVLILFLMNWRTVIISLSALPLSLLLGMMILNWTGQGINTMTLGGLAVAIGSVVDDAIVDMENVYRRLRENQQAGTPINPLQVVFNGSVEVRVSVLFSTVIIAVVFAPIFALSGVEGRIFTPMGVSYLLSIIASTLVALTLTPALCALLLVNRRLPDNETWVARFSHKVYRPALMFSIRRPQMILIAAVASFIASMLILPSLGRVFLPEFQESSLVIATSLYPGESLEATNTADLAIQDALKNDKRFAALQLRSGRAPGDSDVGGVNFGELDVELSALGIKNREASIETLRQEFAKLPGVAANIGGFISHRLDEVLSGVRSAIAVKIFGSDLEQLRTIGKQVESAISNIPGIVDLQLEPQVPIKQVQIRFDRAAASRYGLAVGDLAQTIQTALNGRVVSQVLEQQQVFDLVVWLQESARNNLETISNLLIDVPNGQKIPLAYVAKVEYGTGPNTINRENVSRLIIVSANVNGRDLGSVIKDIRSKVKQQVQFPSGYYIQYGGQFQAQEQATQTLIWAGILAFIAITVLIYFAVQSIPATVMIMINLPLALVGGVISVALGGGIISVASMVGFITLFGVATRNGLLLVDNYNNKLASGMPLREVLVEGSMERLVAILMTALSSALGMVPLVIGTGAGKEILQPLAVVVLGGLFTSTALTLLVIPALYSLFGRFLVPKKTTQVQEIDVTQGSVV